GQDLASIGASDLARPLVAIQRQGIGAQLFDPEAVLESGAQGFRGNGELGGALLMTQRRRQQARAPLGGIDIGLDLAQGDRALRQLAIGMHDGIAGILPALIGQAVLADPVIFDKAVAVAVAILCIQASAASRWGRSWRTVSMS